MQSGDSTRLDPVNRQPEGASLCAIRASVRDCVALGSLVSMTAQLKQHRL